MKWQDLCFELVSRIRHHERVFFPLIRANRRLRRIRGMPLVDADTELVIEGYFRCANTFATLAFVQAQEKKRKIANHTHAPASVVRAVRLGILSLVLIRHPADVAVSHALKFPGLSLAQSLKWYRRFYEHIWPHRRSIVIADFSEVTFGYGQVIHRVNGRFGTNFVPFVHNEENVARVFRRIRKTDLRLNPNDRNRVSVPSSSKEEAKAALRRRLQSPEPKHRLARASAIYRQFISLHT